MLFTRRTVVTASLCTVLFLAGCTSGTNNQPTTGKQNPGYAIDSTMPAGTFGSDTEGSYSGDLYVTGYVDIQTMNEPFCMSNCKKFSYASLHVQRTGNDHLADFLGVNEGNAYVGPARIGLGCAEGEIVRYANHSDKYEMKEFRVSSDLSVQILHSSPSDPVTLHLVKLPLEGGTEAPACYAHFIIQE
jgi:hypothetical protein